MVLLLVVSVGNTSNQTISHGLGRGDYDWFRKMTQVFNKNKKRNSVSGWNSGAMMTFLRFSGS